MFEQAAAALRGAEEASQDGVALCRLGRLEHRLGRLDEAEAAYEQAIKKAPDWSLPYEALALLLRDRGVLERAATLLDKALQIRPTARTLTILGNVLWLMGDGSGARLRLEEAIRLDDRFEEAYYNLAMVEERPEDRVALLARAVELDSQYALAHRELGWALRRLGNLPEAQEHIRVAVDLDPGDEWALVYLGNTLWARGDLGGAERAFRRAMDLFPQWSVACWCLGDVCETQGRLAEADELHLKAARLNPDDPAAAIRAADFWLAIGRVDVAQRTLATAVAAHPESRRASAALRDLLSLKQRGGES